jgi:hypothetical protein
MQGINGQDPLSRSKLPFSTKRAIIVPRLAKCRFGNFFAVFALFGKNDPIFKNVQNQNCSIFGDKSSVGNTSEGDNSRRFFDGASHIFMRGIKPAIVSPSAGIGRNAAVCVFHSDESLAQEIVATLESRRGLRLSELLDKKIYSLLLGQRWFIGLAHGWLPFLPAPMSSANLSTCSGITGVFQKATVAGGGSLSYQSRLTYLTDF